MSRAHTRASHRALSDLPLSLRIPGLLLGAAGLLLGACGREESGPAPLKLKLVDQPFALIEDRQETEPLATLLDEGFDGGLGEWRLSTDFQKPLIGDPEVLQVSFPSEGGDPVLRLAGRRGVLYRILPVQPESTYVFSARTRSNELRAEAPFFNAAPWIAELTSAGPTEELMAQTPQAPLVAARHLFETCIDTYGWQEHERVFVTGPETRALLVVANYSFTDGILGGSVDFDDFRLQAVPARVAWDLSLEAAQADYRRGEEPLGDWRDQLLVRGYLGAEVRPSILSFPGQRTRFELHVPATRPLLEGGVGPWPAALLGEREEQLSFEVRVQGESIWTHDQVAKEASLEAGWHEFALDLEPWAGQRVELELRSSGSLPGLFGAPTLRDRAPQPGRRNLILISLDTLRADYVGAYGAPGDPTPKLDAFAANGILCKRVDGQATYTLPGHATMFSGQFPSVHGAQRPSQVFSGTRSPILARILSQQGYRTEAFTGGGLMNADFGFDKGFDRFANIDPLRHKDSRFFQSMLENDPVAKQRLRRNRQGPTKVTREMIERYGPEQLNAWLDKHKDEPFFLFVHTYSVHDYDPPDEFLHCRSQGCEVQRRDYNEFRLTRKRGWNPQPVSDAERDHMRHLYDGTVRQADHLVGQLLDHIRELGLDQNTVVAIATDHGEEMFERGFQQHGKTLYEEMTRLPLMLQIPGVEPRVIEEPVMMIDLAPTLLSALGLPREPRMNGRDLLEPVPADRVTFSEIHDDFVHKYALRTADGYKIIYAPEDQTVSFPAENEWELYQTKSDAGEEHELSESEPDTLKRMQEELLKHRALLQALGKSLDSVGSATLSEAVQDQLNELGYGESIEQDE